MGIRDMNYLTLNLLLVYNGLSLSTKTRAPKLPFTRVPKSYRNLIPCLVTHEYRGDN